MFGLGVGITNYELRIVDCNLFWRWGVLFWMVRVIFVFGFLVGVCFGQVPVFTAEVGEGLMGENRVGYDGGVRGIEAFRVEQGRMYGGGSEKVKEVVLVRVRERLEGDLCDEIFPSWYGTKWDFMGFPRCLVRGKWLVVILFLIVCCIWAFGWSGLSWLSRLRRRLL